MKNAAPVRALVADDESHIRLLMKTMLKTMRVEDVTEAKNGAEAVEMFTESRPHITLLDINMPFKNGIESLREIIARDAGAFVIMMTSLSDSDTVRQCLESGAAHYIRKDTPIAEMKDIIARAWRRHHGGTEQRDD